MFPGKEDNIQGSETVELEIPYLTLSCRKVRLGAVIFLMTGSKFKAFLHSHLQWFPGSWEIQPGGTVSSVRALHHAPASALSLPLLLSLN